MRVYPVHTTMGASKINIDSIGKKGDIKPKTIWVHFKYTKWVDRGILAVLDSRSKGFKIGKLVSYVLHYIVVIMNILEQFTNSIDEQKF